MIKPDMKEIKVIAMDVDGVMTDGRIIYDGTGKELKFFDVQDGYAIARARKEGLKTAVISARTLVTVSPWSTTSAPVAGEPLLPTVRVPAGRAPRIRTPPLAVVPPV